VDVRPTGQLIAGTSSPWRRWVPLQGACRGAGQIEQLRVGRADGPCPRSRRFALSDTDNRPRGLATVPTPVPVRPSRAILEPRDSHRLRIVAWIDPVADPHGVHPCSRYVELYWLGIIGPSTTWLLRRLSYGLDLHPTGFDLDLKETAQSLGLGDRMGKNSPFRRALQRLCTFELARPRGPGTLAVRTRIPPLALRHLSRLPDPLRASHRRWAAEQRLPEPEQMRRRARRLADGLAASGAGRAEIERRLAQWHFHPSVAFRAADEAAGSGPRQPGSSS
jgi:hypothetical protein